MIRSAENVVIVTLTIVSLSFVNDASYVFLIWLVFKVTNAKCGSAFEYVCQTA